MRQAIILLLWSLMMVSDAWGTRRETVLAELDQLPNHWRDVGLHVQINDGAVHAFPLGTQVLLHFWAKDDCYIWLIHVNSHGVVSLMTPRFGQAGNFLRARQAIAPSLRAKMAAVIAPPLGQERLYVLATQKPLNITPLEKTVHLAHRGVAAQAGARGIVRLVREQMMGTQNTSAVAKLDYRVLGRSEEREYTAKDIVDYFTSKSLSRPSLDVHINFPFDSATLDDRARNALQVWGEALADSTMQEAVFVIGGHTDDVGSEAYNLKLARRRGEAVVAYLTQQFHLAPHRFQIKAYGESKPLEPGTSPETRAANRRVEFELAQF